MWNGAEGALIIDPAVYYGHREADLGMTFLFGGFPPNFYAAYEAAFPLPEGWRERIALYELYHQLNHLNLFGSGYLAGVLNRCAAYQ
jgi:protein-ribulosamine 3-kinase